MFDLSTINWAGFIQVAAAALGFSTVIGLAFALGVRLHTNAQNHVSKANKGKAGAVQAEALNRVGAYLLFAICAAALIFGLYLILVMDGYLPNPFLPPAK